jgi:hypothetical protein
MLWVIKYAEQTTVNLQENAVSPKANIQRQKQQKLKFPLYTFQSNADEMPI